MVVHVISFNHTVNIVKNKFEPIICIVYFFLEGCFVSVVCLQIAEHNKIANRCAAPRPAMTDEGTETAFRLDQRKHFRKVNIS